MMHTTPLITAPEGNAAMVHNADFSGDVSFVYTNSAGDTTRWSLPGWLVQAIRENATESVLAWLGEFPVCDVEVG